MILLFALVVALLFGVGTFLMLKRDLLRVVGGVILVSNAATFFIIAAGLRQGRAPIYPLPEGVEISDPLVQAMALTAVVISFGITAFLLSLVYRVYTIHDTLDQIELFQQDVIDEAETDREIVPETKREVELV